MNWIGRQLCRRWLSALSLGAAMGGSPVAAHPRGDAAVTARHAIYGLGDWQLQIDHDRFTGSVICRLRARDRSAFYVDGALAFRVGRRIEVTEAAFRVDNGAPHLWRDEIPELARLRIAIGGRDLNRPFDGLIWIAADRIAGASILTLAPYRHARVRSFPLQGFQALRDAAGAQGCPDTGWRAR